MLPVLLRGRICAVSLQSPSALHWTCSSVRQLQINDAATEILVAKTADYFTWWVRVGPAHLSIGFIESKLLQGWKSHSCSVAPARVERAYWRQSFLEGLLCNRLRILPRRIVYQRHQLLGSLCRRTPISPAITVLINLIHERPQERCCLAQDGMILVAMRCLFNFIFIQEVHQEPSSFRHAEMLVGRSERFDLQNGRMI